MIGKLPKATEQELGLSALAPEPPWKRIPLQTSEACLAPKHTHFRRGQSREAGLWHPANLS